MVSMILKGTFREKIHLLPLSSEIVLPILLMLPTTYPLLWLLHLSWWLHCLVENVHCLQGRTVLPLGLWYSFHCNIPHCCVCIGSFCWLNMLWLLVPVLHSNLTVVSLSGLFSALVLLVQWQENWVLGRWWGLLLLHSIEMCLLPPVHILSPFCWGRGVPLHCWGIAFWLRIQLWCGDVVRFGFCLVFHAWNMSLLLLSIPACMRELCCCHSPIQYFVASLSTVMV